jgi:hypothetical protein
MTLRGRDASRDYLAAECASGRSVFASPFRSWAGRRHPRPLRSPGRVLPQRVRSGLRARCRRQPGRGDAHLALRTVEGVLRELQLHAGFSRATVSGGSSLYGLLACDRLGSASRARQSRPYTPCMRLYGYLGTELAKTVGAGNPYQQWVTTYSGADFQAVVTRVESLLDSIPEDTLAVRDAYEHSMRCALNSFSAMLEPTA